MAIPGIKSILPRCPGLEEGDLGPGDSLLLPTGVLLFFYRAGWGQTEFRLLPKATPEGNQLSSII